MNIGFSVVIVIGLVLLAGGWMLSKRKNKAANDTVRPPIVLPPVKEKAAPVAKYAAKTAAKKAVKRPATKRK